MKLFYFIFIFIIFYQILMKEAYSQAKFTSNENEFKELKNFNQKYIWYPQYEDYPLLLISQNKMGKNLIRLDTKKNNNQDLLTLSYCKRKSDRTEESFKMTCYYLFGGNYLNFNNFQNFEKNMNRLATFQKSRDSNLFDTAMFYLLLPASGFKLGTFVGVNLVEAVLETTFEISLFALISKGLDYQYAKSGITVSAEGECEEHENLNQIKFKNIHDIKENDDGAENDYIKELAKAYNYFYLNRNTPMNRGNASVQPYYQLKIIDDCPSDPSPIFLNLEYDFKMSLNEQALYARPFE
jgi:hypothetical protein